MSSQNIAVARLPVENQLHEAGKTFIEVLEPNAATALETMLPLPNDTRFSECLEVVGEARLGTVEAEPTARVVVLLRVGQESLDDRKPQRVGKNAHHSLQA